MKCFNHTSIDAIGICKNCQKGLCMDCAVDVGNGIACKGACVDEVIAINKITQQSKKAFAIAGKTYKQNAVWIFLLGLVFIILSLFTSPPSAYLIILGIIMWVGAIFYFFAGRRYDEKTAQP